MYYGNAAIDVDNARIRLITNIGTQVLKYTGKSDESELHFTGQHSVIYKFIWWEGRLLGKWDNGGIEELILSSPFFYHTVFDTK